MLACETISKTFGATSVLVDVSVRVTPGEATVIIGPSGSGKTTVLRSMAMLEPPSAGTIVLDGTHYDFPNGKPRNMRPIWPRVTMVFQQLFLWPHLTLAENCLLPSRLNGVSDAPVLFKKLVGEFALEEALERLPSEASFGERQRAALIRALLLNPRYLLLDEVTSALDVEQIEAVLRCLRKLKEQCVGICVVTHLLGLARRVADTVVFMERGRVLETGRAEILAAPREERVARFVSMLRSGE